MDELRTDFTRPERNTMIANLRDEYGDREFSEELINLELQDLWRKGCHHLESMCFMPSCRENNGHCPLDDWEKQHPEYKDDAIAKRLKELRDELRKEARAEHERYLLEKGWIKVQRKQRNDGELSKSQPLLYLPGSEKLKADLCEAIANWKNMWGCYFYLAKIDLNAKSGVILKLHVEQGDDYEIWEIIK